MGCSIYAYIQLKESTGSVSTWDLTSDEILGCHDYEFFAAISGIRGKGGKDPLIAPRGLPKLGPWEVIPVVPPDGRAWDIHTERVAHMLRGALAVGWLKLSEIEAAMAHMSIKEADRAEPVKRVLAIMRFLESGIGKDNVWLVFGFKD